MQGKIAVMPEELSNRIAAGEVVERPSSIVKELIENSLDAGATDILIELEGGGKSSIKVVDNGSGIDRNDVGLVFERHATSKIDSFEDIYSIDSFGFRGEAMASIASISRVEILTKRSGEAAGTRAVLKGGRIDNISDAGCPAGTSVKVSDIFYSTPVRKKFMKGDSTEQAHCMDVIVRLALSNPGVKIRVLANGRDMLNIPKADRLFDRISLVFGDDFGKKTIKIDGRRGDVTIRGVISMPDHTRSNSKGQFYFVNKRFIRDKLFNNAVAGTYRRLIEPRRFPYVALFIDMPTDEVDINVHPSKMEVRFKNPSEIYSLIRDTLSNALAGISITLNDFRTPGKDQYLERIGETLHSYTLQSGTQKRNFESNPRQTGVLAGVKPRALQNTAANESGLFSAKNIDDTEDRVSFSSLKYLGQVAGTYLVFSSEKDLVLIDQHAAHERVLFEKLKVSKGGKVLSQGLLIPEVISLQPGRFALLMDIIESLQDYGLGVEAYGENTIIIKHVPAFLTGTSLEDLVSDIIEEIRDTGKSDGVAELRDKILTMMACKGAVKANSTLTGEEVASLCEDLDTMPFAATCPHGRPLYSIISLRELERMFKRL